MKIGFIGTGAIAAAMVRALAGQGHEIWVSHRGAATAKALEAEFVEVRRQTNEEIAAEADVVFLCLMASTAHQILPGLPFRAGQPLISVMVDVSLDQLRQLAPQAGDIEITIPLPQIATGGCPLPCYPRDHHVGQIFGPSNPSFVVQDARALNAHFAATALMSTTLDQISHAANWLADYTGDAPAAEFYISHILASALKTIGPHTQVTDMLQDLSTEGGLNATLKAHMRQAGTPAALAAGLNGFEERLGL